MGKYNCCGLAYSHGGEHDRSDGEDHLEIKVSVILTAPEVDAVEGNQPVQRWIY